MDLYGSLAKTGRGHGTDVAVQLGLCGEDPEAINVANIRGRIRDIARTKRIQLLGAHEITFDPETDIAFLYNQQLPFHPNAMRFTARLHEGTEHDAVFYSVGGGFIVRENETPAASQQALSFPIDTADELLAHCQANSCRISDIVMRNELCWRNESEIRDRLAAIRDTMIDSIYRGCHTEGILPGGLNVERRAARMARNLLGGACPIGLEEWTAAIRNQPHDFQRVLNADFRKAKFDDNI